MITEITTAPPIKVVVPLLGHYFIPQNSRFFFLVMWDEWSTLLSDTNQHEDLIQESLVAENYIATHYSFQNEILFTKIQ